MSLIAILTFNPYKESIQKYSKDQPRHPKGSREGGRFADGKRSRGIDFVSPNKGNLTYSGAKQRLGSQEQAHLTALSGRVNKALGIKGSIHNVVGAWADGAENSTVGVYNGDVPYETIRVAASMKGLLEQQKAVIAFKAREGGKARITEITLPGNMDDHHQMMLDGGIEFHTLQPIKGGVKAWVFQEESNEELNGLLSSYAGLRGGKLETWAGDGEFIGSWDSREEGKIAYVKEIQAYTDKHPTNKKEIDKILGGHT